MTKERKHLFLKWGSLLLIVGAFVFIRPLGQGLVEMTSKLTSIEDVRTYIQSFGSTALIISFLMMILQSIVAPVPAFFITFANAVIWGWWKGAILSWTSSMAGASLCFWISRIYGRGIAEKFVSKAGLEEVDEFFARYGNKTILVARLLPFVPFDPISYAAGLTPMGFMEFFLATGLGQLPATLIYSYAASQSTNPATWTTGLLILFGLFGLAYLLKTIYQDRKKKQNKKMDEA